MHWLGEELDTSSLPGRVSAIVSSMVVFGIIHQQRRQLPNTFMRLGFSQMFHEHTTITFMDGYVQKQVKLSSMPHLANELARLKQVYQAVKGCKYIAEVVDGPSVSRTYYTVSVRPCGFEVSGAPGTPKQLKVAIR